jgi:hypothetical protein
MVGDVQLSFRVVRAAHRPHPPHPPPRTRQAVTAEQRSLSTPHHPSTSTLPHAVATGPCQATRGHAAARGVGPPGRVAYGGVLKITDGASDIEQ